MTAITFQVGFTGSPDESDIRAANYIITNENDRIIAENRNRDENNQLPLLPNGTGAEIKASYLVLLEAIITSAHASYVTQANDREVENANIKELWRDASDVQRTAAIAALTQ